MRWKIWISNAADFMAQDEGERTESDNRTQLESVPGGSWMLHQFACSAVDNSSKLKCQEYLNCSSFVFSLNNAAVLFCPVAWGGEAVCAILHNQKCGFFCKNELFFRIVFLLFQILFLQALE